MITQSQLKSQLQYDKYTGEFSWDKSKPGVSKARFAGSKYKDGYYRIQIQGKIYKRSRLAWLYTYGRFPNQYIDHINRVRSDDRISNLRDVSRLENNRNKYYKPSVSGVTGVLWYKPNKKWVSKIRVEGRLLHLGYFKDLEEATLVRKEAEIKYGFYGGVG